MRDVAARGALEVYGDPTAALTRALHPPPIWRDKHELNLRLVRSLVRPGGAWLDTCCGQAWHFTAVDGVVKTGIDLSAAQLVHARRDNPTATFLEADVLDVELDARFDLVSNFWGAYSYLDVTRGSPRSSAARSTGRAPADRSLELIRPRREASTRRRRRRDRARALR